MSQQLNPDLESAHQAFNFCIYLCTTRLKGERWTWNQRFIRGLGPILSGDEIFLLDYFVFT